MYKKWKRRIKILSFVTFCHNFSQFAMVRTFLRGVRVLDVRCKRNEKVKELYIDGYGAKEIANLLNDNYDRVRQYINRHLKEYKNVHLENKSTIMNENIKNLYIRGYTAKEISQITNTSYATIRKHISLNLSTHKKEHLENKNRNREIIKAIDNMNNSYIPNSSFLSWNRQSYDYNKNGNLVFNENRGNRPKDVPKTFYQKDGAINNGEESINTISMALNLLK